jgi:hypothetical protein
LTQMTRRSPTLLCRHSIISRSRARSR